MISIVDLEKSQKQKPHKIGKLEIFYFGALFVIIVAAFFSALLADLMPFLYINNEDYLKTLVNISTSSVSLVAVMQILSGVISKKSILPRYESRVFLPIISILLLCPTPFVLIAYAKEASIWICVFSFIQIVTIIYILLLNTLQTQNDANTDKAVAEYDSSQRCGDVRRKLFLDSFANEQLLEKFVQNELEKPQTDLYPLGEEKYRFLRSNCDVPSEKLSLFLKIVKKCSPDCDSDLKIYLLGFFYAFHSQDYEKHLSIMLKLPEIENHDASRWSVTILEQIWLILLINCSQKKDDLLRLVISTGSSESNISASQLYSLRSTLVSNIAKKWKSGSPDIYSSIPIFFDTFPENPDDQIIIKIAVSGVFKYLSALYDDLNSNRSQNTKTNAEINEEITEVQKIDIFGLIDKIRVFHANTGNTQAQDDDVHDFIKNMLPKKGES